MNAVDFLEYGKKILGDRGKDYDKEQERSMGKTVDAFNIITGQNLSEAEGWLLLQLLKDVRQWTKPEYHEDSAVDCVNYAALKAEALSTAPETDNLAERLKEFQDRGEAAGIRLSKLVDTSQITGRNEQEN